MLSWLLLSISVGLASGAEASEPAQCFEPLAAEIPSRRSSPPITRVESIAPQNDIISRARLVGGRFVAARCGVEEPLTLSPPLQTKLTEILRRYDSPYAAVVAIEPTTGRVLAMAEHSQANPSLRGLCTRAVFPAASVFKIVTAAALLEAGIGPATTRCFRGGKRRLKPSLLEDSARDGRCYDLPTALAMSGNVVFAKLTRDYLSTSGLAEVARAFRFNASIDFAVPTDTSLAAFPEDQFGLANTAAGFGDVYLSPLHGALIAGATANGGRWTRPVLFEADFKAPSQDRVVSPEVAQALTEMLEQTVVAGTARRVFQERGFQVPGAVGKTGSLADYNPFREYTWFVGFAPKQAPRVAVAAVVVNGNYWRIKATWLGREAMRLYLTSPSVESNQPGFDEPLKELQCVDLPEGRDRDDTGQVASPIDSRQ